MPRDTTHGHTREQVLKRGVAAGRSAQRACERSSDWRRGAAGSPDPDKCKARNLAVVSREVGAFDLVVPAGMVG